MQKTTLDYTRLPMSMSAKIFLSSENVLQGLLVYDVSRYTWIDVANTQCKSPKLIVKDHRPHTFIFFKPRRCLVSQFPIKCLFFKLPGWHPLEPLVKYINCGLMVNSRKWTNELHQNCIRMYIYVACNSK